MQKGIDYTGITIVFFCHDGCGNFLLSKRSSKARDEQGTWDPGGGALEFGDTIENTLRKEIKEEYCTDVLSYEFLGYRDVHRIRDGKPDHWIALDFNVLIDPKKVKNGEPHKLDEVKFFRFETIPHPVHSQFPKFLKLYKKKIQKEFY